MQESSSSHSIPHVALLSDPKAPSISYSASHTTDMSNAQSSSTPQFKKKLIPEKSSSTRESGGSQIAKHQSFDYAKSMSFIIWLPCRIHLLYINFHIIVAFTRFAYGIIGSFG